MLLVLVCSSVLTPIFALDKTVLLDSVSVHLFSRCLIQDERAAQRADLR